ncbi:DODA-type extradiol aromatic ring-opening family dioxygenase [Paenibacillus xylanexedens]|uniref:DODA-type extradiol aromatic ring-opening family dioxygenase n=1 Tax=Paenibacillus xylanexedens TaxID=528191 RepID=UPI0011A4DEE4|nr:class III extradiol ring-cleavage dioxygenase [Paenibacillus xylanexedens]
MIPALFICHGSPMLAIQSTPYTEFLRDTGKQFEPSAIVVLSAHWEQPVTTISFAEGTLETIYDFGGFPDELYHLDYPAKGSPVLAENIEQRLRAAGIPTRRDVGRGLDHGSWVFLRHMYPKANIPIVSISVNPFFTTAEQLEIGNALKGLSEESILVIGSGTTVHNFNEIRFQQKYPEPWAIAFDDWIVQTLVNRDTDALMRYTELAPHARRAVPRAEHFVPLFHAYGSAPGRIAPRAIYKGYEMGTFSQLCIQFS